MSMIQAWSVADTPTLLAMSGSAAANPVRSTWNRKPLTLAAKSGIYANREEGFPSRMEERFPSGMEEKFPSGMEERFPSGIVGSSASVIFGWSAIAIGWRENGLGANEAFSKPH